MSLQRPEDWAAPGAAVAERILTHARACFERAGFQKTTIEDIAAAAGVVRQTIYNHFSSKQDIIDRITLREMIKVNEVMRRRMRHSPRFADKIREAVLSSVLVAQGNPYLRRVLYDMDASPQGKLTGAIYAWQRERWRTVLEKGQAAGELRRDVAIDAAVSWLSACQWMLSVKLDQGQITPDELGRVVQGFVMEPLLAHHGTTPEAMAREAAELRRQVASLKDILTEQAIRIRDLERGAVASKAG